MKAVVLAGVGDVRVEDVPEPQVLEPTDAVVAVRTAAICGADLFPLHGLTPGFENGTVLGHEFAGVVVDKGTAVRVELGRRVVNTSMVADGTCPSCRAGRVTQCSGRALFGYSGVYPRLDGGQAELVRVPHADRVLAPLPDEVPDEAAVFLSDNLPTAYDAVVTRGGVRADDLVCVVGLGAVGLMAVMCAVDAGARVLGVDGVDARRRAAADLGAETLPPDDAADGVGAASDGCGADVVVEAAGSPGALDAALRLARGRGTVSVVGAHFEPDFPLDNHLMFERELTLRFSIGDAAGHRDHLLERISAGDLDPARVVSHRLPLEQAAEAYRLFDEREAVKVVLRVSGGA